MDKNEDVNEAIADAVFESNDAFLNAIPEDERFDPRWNTAHMLHKAASGVALAIRFPEGADQLLLDANRHGLLGMRQLQEDLARLRKGSAR